MHLTNYMKKQLATWKFHYHDSSTWASLQVNNNQLVNLTQNQIMKCIICHNEIVALETLALCIKCQKGLIAYPSLMAYGMTFMKKHVELKNSALLKRYMEKIASNFHLNMNEPLNAHMLP